MAIVRNWGARLVGVASCHDVIVAVHVSGRLVVVDGRQQLRAHAACHISMQGSRGLN